jgi:uncharacterized tellurite resistance protein B-like protein
MLLGSRGAQSTGAAANASPDNGESALPTAMLLSWLIKMAYADGTITPTEAEMLSRVADRRGVSSNQLDAMMSAVQHGEMDVTMPASRAQAEAWLRMMAQTAMADGNLSREEFALLRAAGERVGFGSVDMELLVKRVRSDAYASARATLRGGNGASTADQP